MNSTIRAPRPESIGSFQDQKWRESVSMRLLGVVNTTTEIQADIAALDSRVDEVESDVATLQGDSVVYGGTSGGTVNAQTIAPSGVTVYVTGRVYNFIPGANNSGATTLNINGLGAKSVYFMGKPCVGGELVSGVMAQVVDDGTRFQLTEHGGGYATWTPAITSYGTVSGTSISHARWRRFGTKVEIDLLFACTLSGTLGNAIAATLPPGLTPNGTYMAVGSFYQNGVAQGMAIFQMDSGSYYGLLSRYDYATLANVTGTYSAFGYYVTAN